MVMVCLGEEDDRMERENKDVKFIICLVCRSIPPTWYILESQHMKKFFDFIQLPNFDIAADAAATFK
ncbi:putative MO25-like protein, partial [Tanacetum coccineum]